MKLTPKEFVRYLEDNGVLECAAYDINEAFPEGVEAVQREVRRLMKAVAFEAVAIELPD